MTHPLSGFASVEDSARLIRNHRYAVERMMRILAGWIALTPELSAKLLIGRHVWDNAQHADLLGRRLPELRSPVHVSEPANPAFVTFMDAVEEPEGPHQTVERVVGIYGVLKPHLLASYDAHLAQTNEVYEPPTRRILERCAGDERRHIAAGHVVLRHLLATPALEARAAAWHASLAASLAASGGVTGSGLAASAPTDRTEPATSLSDDPREFLHLEQSGRCLPVPEELESAVREFAGALIAREVAAIARFCLPGVEPGPGVESALATRRATGSRVVAFAKIGSHRLVKLRLEGPDGSVTLATRWVSAEGGWRAAALDVVALDAATAV